MSGFVEPTQVTKFLGSTVLSFNASIGLGSAQESSFNVDLIKDCDDIFTPEVGVVKVGSPVVFPDSGPFNFYFGGILTSWVNNIDSGGQTYKATVTDPRQLLENLAIIIDTYMGFPMLNTNYVNAYNYWEGSVLSGDCANFGRSGVVGDRGMPLVSIIDALQSLNPVLTSSTGYNFSVNWSDLSFLSSVPSYYRIPGPYISALQLLQEGCEALGYEFYVYMDRPNIIRIGYIDLRVDPPSIEYTIASFEGTATELSYRQELRNDKTKKMIIGENLHYMTYSDRVSYFFGEEQTANGVSNPVVPYSYTSNNGFWISKTIRDINPTLYAPLPSNGPYTLSEMDIRCAMSSFDLWLDRVFDSTVPGTLNAAIRSRYAGYAGGASFKQVLDLMPASIIEKYYAANDVMVAPKANTTDYENVFQLDLEALHGWVQELGNTYYGKQILVGLPDYICYQGGPNYGELVFTDTPTNEGGWLEYGSTYLGLPDPDLGLFRESDGRLGCFVRFNQGYYIPPSSISPVPDEGDCFVSPGDGQTYCV